MDICRSALTISAVAVALCIAMPHPGGGGGPHPGGGAPHPDSVTLSQGSLTREVVADIQPQLRIRKPLARIRAVARIPAAVLLILLARIRVVARIQAQRERPAATRGP